MNENQAALPDQLLANLADSELELISWDQSRLAVRITKEIGPEQGQLEFLDPSFVSLPPRMGIAGIRIVSLKDLPPDFFESRSPSAQTLDPAEQIYLIEGSWGDRCFVIAAGVNYRKFA